MRTGMLVLAWAALAVQSCAHSDDLDATGSGGSGGNSGSGGSAASAGSGASGGSGGGAVAAGSGGSSGSAAAAGSGASGGSAGSGGSSAAGGAGGSAGGAGGTAGSAATGGAGGSSASGGAGGSSANGGAAGTASAGAGGTAGSGGGGGDASTCLSYANDFDTASAAQEWTPGNVAVGSQWGQFGHHWEWGTPTTGPGADHSGSGALWGNRLDVRYSYFESSYLQSPAVDLSGASSATLSFWHYLDLEWCTSSCGSGNPTPTALDGANVSCWNGTDYVLAAPSGGYPSTIRMFDSFTPVHPMKDQPGFGFDPQFDPAWKQETIALPNECLRSDARVRLQFGSDSSSSSLNGQGWFVDDVRIDAVCQ